MTKNAFPMMKTGSGVGKKLLGMAVGLALLTMVINKPVEAATWTKHGFAHLEGLINALAAFLGGVLG